MCKVKIILRNAITPDLSTFNFLLAIMNGFVMINVLVEKLHVMDNAKREAHIHPCVWKKTNVNKRQIHVLANAWILNSQSGRFR